MCILKLTKGFNIIQTMQQKIRTESERVDNVQLKWETFDIFSSFAKYPWNQSPAKKKYLTTDTTEFAIGILLIQDYK